MRTAVSELANQGFGVALIGGPGVEKFNRSVAATNPERIRAFNTSADVRALFALISGFDLLVTGDTLAMHAAWALSTPIVALFGPTSLAEIDLAPGDVKLAASQLPCLGCYLHTCSVDPHCMDLLTPDLVLDAVLERLNSKKTCA